MSDIPKQPLIELRKQGVYTYDWSSMSTYISCPRAFYYRHELGLRRTSETPSPALMFGLSVHKALEVWYPTKENDDAALAVFRKEFTPYAEAPTISYKTGKELGATYSVIFGCSLLDAYFATYRKQQEVLLENEIPVGEELTDNVLIAGRLDKVLLIGGRIVIMDHKTSKYMNRYRTSLNGQFMLYITLGMKLLDKNVGGVLDILGVSKTAKPHELLRREPFEYSAYQLTEWRKSFIKLVELVTKSRNESFWPQTWQCDPYFRECPYLPLCTSQGTNSHDSLVANLYETKFWDPFEVD